MATLKDILGDAYKADMTLADIESALNGKNLADLSGGQYVSVSKHNSIVNGLTAERDDYKAKYTETLNEAQKAELANAEREQKYKAIERENSINRYEKKLSSSVKDESIRNEIAIAMAHCVSLSATGSSIFPKSVTILNFLAIFPSKKSDKNEIANTPKAHQYSFDVSA